MKQLIMNTFLCPFDFKETDDKDKPRGCAMIVGVEILSEGNGTNFSFRLKRVGHCGRIIDNGVLYVNMLRALRKLKSLL